MCFHATLSLDNGWAKCLYVQQSVASRWCSLACACDGIPAQGGLSCVEQKIGKKRSSKPISVKSCMFKTINGEDHDLPWPDLTCNLPSIRPFDILFQPHLALVRAILYHVCVPMFVFPSLFAWWFLSPGFSLSASLPKTSRCTLHILLNFGCFQGAFTELNVGAPRHVNKLITFVPMRRLLQGSSAGAENARRPWWGA